MSECRIAFEQWLKDRGMPEPLKNSSGEYAWDWNDIMWFGWQAAHFRNKSLPKLYAAAYLVIISGDNVLLLNRLNTGYRDGEYSLVAGHFEVGETAKQCAIREAYEEAGIHIHPDDLSIVHVAHRYSPSIPPREYFDVYLKTQSWTGDIRNMEPEKCAELGWFPLNALPNNMVPEVKEVLGHISDGTHYSSFGWAREA